MKDFTLKAGERESLYQLYLYAFNRQDSPKRKSFLWIELNMERFIE